MAEQKEKGERERASRNLSDPVTSPFYFESPRIATELRAIFLHQQITETSSLRGRELAYTGGQARLAVTDKLALLLTRAGYVDLNTGAFGEEEGASNLAIGAKLLLVEGEQFLISGGTRFEFASGDRDALSGSGDGEWSPFLSMGWYFDEVDLVSSVTWKLPLDKDAQSTQVHVGVHADYRLFSWLRPFVEVNIQSIINDGKRTNLSEEGFDLFNLGIDGTGGNDVVTLAAGARARIWGDLSAGAAFEIPVTDRKDLLQQRVVVDLVLGF
jgi:hypothetical protein